MNYTRIRTIRRHVSIFKWAVLGAGLLLSFVVTGLGAGARVTQDWCRTQTYYQEKLQAGQRISPESCTAEGQCDEPSTRDLWIPEADEGMIFIRMYIHVFTNDNGTSRACSEENVADAVADLNQDFLPLRIQFIYEMRFVQSSRYRYLADNEMNAMKAATALDPDSQLNIFVGTVEEGYSYGTFPWDSDALGPRGGVVMNNFQFPPYNFGDFTHEVGHNLGLWHTHHGVDEVEQCGSCYEIAGGTDGNTTGDFCADTDPTPTNYNCGPPGGTDPCSGTPWGATHYKNIMGYAPGSCYTNFSEQQWGRMHCWLNNELSGWISGVNFVGGPVFGSAPLSVEFTGQTGKQVDQWRWDFGDGDTASEANPTHVYNQPGYYTISVSVETPDGQFVSTKPGYVSAYADTLGAEDVQGQSGQPVRADINLTNYIPVDEITIPFTWAGPFNLTYDSMSVAGLRTEYFENMNVLNYDLFNDRITVRLGASSTGAAPYLEPGNGPVLSLFFTIPTWVQTGTNPIAVTAYGSHTPKLRAQSGEYVPIATVGSLTVGCCKGSAGNVDDDPLDMVDLSDLTRLIDYLFISFTPPACPEEANVDGDPLGMVDLSDLTRMIDYLFMSLTQPPECL